MRLDTEYKIDGTPILVPDADLAVEVNDLDDEQTGRDEAGYMHRVVLRTGVRTWSLSYSNLTQEEYAYTANLLFGKKDFLFSFQKPDGTEESVRCYCTKHRFFIRNRKTGAYKNLTFNIIEC